jgi:hypothetical protein
MQAQLQNVEDSRRALAFQFRYGVEIPRIDYEWFLAYCVRMQAERKTNMGVVQIIRRTDGNIVHFTAVVLPPQLLQMSVEAFNFREEIGFGEKPINDTHGIMRVYRSNQFVSSVADGLHVAWGDEPGGADKSKSLSTHVDYDMKKIYISKFRLAVAPYSEGPP